MYDYTGWIVQATAGRDRDGIFCVVGMDRDQERLLLADGKRRKTARPKAKKLGHVKPLTDRRHGFDHPRHSKADPGRSPVGQGIETGAGCVPRSTGGMTLWQKTT